MTKEQEILANRIKNKKQHSLNVIDEIMSSVKITELRAVTNKEETEIISYSLIVEGNKYIKQIEPLSKDITILDLIFLETQGVVKTRRWGTYSGNKVISYKPKKIIFFKKDSIAIKKCNNIFKILNFRKGKAVFEKTYNKSAGYYYQREIMFDDKYVNSVSSFSGPLLDVSFYEILFENLEYIKDSLYYKRESDFLNTKDTFILTKNE
jgi:hypothetical protein